MKKLDKKIGFIGVGNMAKAIIGGIIKSKFVDAKNILIYGPHREKLEKVKRELGVYIGESAEFVSGNVDILFIGVKPNIFIEVLENLKNSIKKNTMIVSIAAGITIDDIEQVITDEYKIIRSMPNTPALVNEGMSSICGNDNILEEELMMVKDIFDSFGKTEILSEDLIHTVIGVSGSSPAYVFMLIEAMADGAVLGGMPREKAYKFAAQAVLGSAKMVLETGKHPGELKDMVCSPGGTTIEAVRTLEEKGFKSAVIEAMVKCMDKSRDMSK